MKDTEIVYLVLTCIIFLFLLGTILFNSVIWLVDVWGGRT